MTKPSRRSSLFQARDSHSRSHSHSFFHRFRHNPLHAHDAKQQAIRDNGSGSGDEHAANVELDSSESELDKRDPSAISEKVVVNAIGSGPNSLVTQVVQTISLVQYVDPWGKAFETKTVYGPPNTVVVDPKSGKTVAISVGAQLTAAHSGSTPGGSGHVSSTPGSIISTSLGPKLTPAVPTSATAKPAYPSVGDIRNSTNSALHSNSSFVAHTNNSSIYKLYSAPVPISTTDLPTTSKAKTKSRSTHSTHWTVSPTTTTISPGNGYGTLTVGGGIPTATQSDTASGGGVNLTPQQKQVIGGVVGAVAGVAVIGLLLMLLLRRYKKRNADRLVLDNQSGSAGSRALGDGSGSGGSMTERSAASGTVAAALASLTGKRAPPTSNAAEGGERGFYRVSGRKLPSVLHNGGDGYSDPRGSATSGSSDYYRGSQAFEPSTAGGGQLALGAPMRPISGVPIIRSGPARVAITENPFADPPTTPNNLSTRTLGSRDSPRASGSRFQEGI